MSQTKRCTNCGTSNQIQARFCFKCGGTFHTMGVPPAIRSPSPTSWLASTWASASNKKWLYLIGGLLVLAAIGGISERLNPKPKPQTSASITTQQPTPTSSPTTSPEVTSSLPASELLAEAKKNLADGYKPNSDPNKTTWGKVAKARENLEAIKPDAKEYAEAQKLLAEVQRREAQIEILAKAGARQIVIEDMERRMLSQGYDFEMSVSGPNKTILRVKYVLMSRPMVYKLTNESDFLENLKEAGFKKVIFTDGYYNSWTYDL